MTNLGDAYGVLGETDRLLEVALIVTDKHLNVLHEVGGVRYWTV